MPWGRHGLRLTVHDDLQPAYTLARAMAPAGDEERRAAADRQLGGEGRVEMDVQVVGCGHVDRRGTPTTADSLRPCGSDDCCERGRGQPANLASGRPDSWLEHLHRRSCAPALASLGADPRRAAARAALPLRRASRREQPPRNTEAVR